MSARRLTPHARIMEVDGLRLSAYPIQCGGCGGDAERQVRERRSV